MAARTVMFLLQILWHKSRSASCVQRDGVGRAISTSGGNWKHEDFQKRGAMRRTLRAYQTSISFFLGICLTCFVSSSWAGTTLDWSFSHFLLLLLSQCKSSLQLLFDLEGEKQRFTYSSFFPLGANRAWGSCSSCPRTSWMTASSLKEMTGGVSVEPFSEAGFFLTFAIYFS